MSLNEFLKLVMVVRTLYGTEPAGAFFEKNLEEFTGLTFEDFKKNLLRPKHNHDTIAPPRDNEQEKRL